MRKVLKKTKRIVFGTGKRIERSIKVFLDEGSIYDDEILLKIEADRNASAYLIVFSHFDRDGKIDPYVINYLMHLKNLGSDIIFVSTAETLTEAEIGKVKDLCFQVIVKKNIGYDFGAWRTGVASAHNFLSEYDRLVLCNDSVYAPLYDLEEMFDTMENKYGFWGITDNYQHGHHIQSYFMVFSKSVFSQNYFLDFWKNIRVFKHKESIIQRYEIGLTKLLRRQKHTYGVYCPSEYKNKKNSTHYEWKRLVAEQKCPVIKIELLRDNPTKTDISDWKEVLQQFTRYNVELINNHLMRIKRSR